MLSQRKDLKEQRNKRGSSYFNHTIILTEDTQTKPFGNIHLSACFNATW